MRFLTVGLASTFLFFSFSVLSRTHQIDRDILNTLHEIEDIIRYDRVSVSQKRRALQSLQDARNALSDFDRRPPGDRDRFFCEARDNDRRRPFVIAYFDRNYEKRQLREVTFGSMATCERALQSTLNLGRNRIACADRDADNRRPYIAFKINERADKVTHIIGHEFHSLDSCYSLLEQHRMSRNGSLLFCSDRDADNRSPYVLINYDFFENEFRRVNDETYRSMNACRETLHRL